MPDTVNRDSRLALLLRLVESITASPDLAQVLGRVVWSAISLVDDSLSTLWISRARGWWRRRAGVRRHPTASADRVRPRRGPHRSRRRWSAGPSWCPTSWPTRARSIAPTSQRSGRGRLRGDSAHLPRPACGRPRARPAACRGPRRHRGGDAHGLRRPRGDRDRGARLYAEAERRRREAETLAGVARDLAECHDLDTVLARIVRGANALCAADVTGLAVRGPDGSFPARHVVGDRSDAYRRFRVVPGLGIGGHAVVSGRPERAADRIAWPPMPPEYAEAIDAEGIRSGPRRPHRRRTGGRGSPLRLQSYTTVVQRRRRERAGPPGRPGGRRHPQSPSLRGRAGRPDEAQTSAQDFGDLVDTLDAIVLDADAETFQVTFVNGRAEAILGYSRQAWYADPNFWINHVHPDDRDWAVALCKEATAEAAITSCSTGC